MENTKQVVPWALILTVVLIIVKMVWVPTMSWWIVFLPLIIPFGIFAVLSIAIIIIAFIAAMLD